MLLSIHTELISDTPKPMTSVAGPLNPFPPPQLRRPSSPPSTTHHRQLPFTLPSSSSFPQSPRNAPPAWRPKTRTTKPAKTAEEERKEEVNRNIASKKAISVILRREATKAVIEKKKGISSRRLLPRTVLEALHERITALRWESALTVFDLLREQLWYRPFAGVYIKLIVMLGKCKQPEKAHELFQLMIDEGCDVSRETFTALLSSYSRSGLFDEAFSLLEEMKNTHDCRPDVQTYSILIKSCLQLFAFDKVQVLLSDMESQGIKPNTVTYNTLIDAYGKAEMYAEMESLLAKMLMQHHCQPDAWTMNSTMRAFGSSGQIELMEKCYEKFLAAGIQPTIRTFNILLDSYGKSENFGKMSAVMEYMQRYHHSWTSVTYNVLIDAFGKAGDLKQMEYLFRLMQSERIKPNCVTFCSLVRAYGRANKAEKIEAVLRFIKNSDVMLDRVFFNCLMDAYGRMERFVEMKEVLGFMESKGCEPDRITYRTMINAYSSAGMNRHVKEVKQWLRSLPSPNPYIVKS